MKRRLKIARGDQRGAVLVEFVFVAIILLVIFGSILELGLLAYNKNVVDNASRVGARGAIVAGADAGAVRSSVINYCTDRLIDLPHGRSGVTAADIEIDGTSPGAGDILVRVRYRHTFQLVSLIDGLLSIIGAGQIGLDSLEIQGMTVMRRE
jgi:Flp pilus assembly protein TadG